MVRRLVVQGVLGFAIPIGACLLAVAAPVAAMENAPAYYAKWSNGIPSDPNYFPIAVWLQSPPNAVAYKNNAGVNLFVGLWEGPTESQLAALKTAGMPVLCDQNAVGLAHAADKTIMAWTHDDEPDNAQADGSGGWGPPVDPSVVIQKYNTLKGKDATRPIYLNLGQGVAWDGWYGRGVRTNHPEDYFEYVKGCDIASYDIYPVNSKDAAVSGKLWYVPQGVDRLRTYTGDAKPVWCWIECTKIGADSPAKPTPAQVRSEVWMALIHGANGIGYFCHSWTPSFDEAALLHDTTMCAAVKALNDQIKSLASVLNSPTIKGEISVASSNAAVPIDILVKRQGGATYLFAAAMREGTSTGTFTVPSGTAAEVLGEGRQLAISGGTFSDSFSSYGIHLYKIPDVPPSAPANLRANAVSTSQINLSWTDNATNETGFKIERKTGSEGTWGQIASVGVNVTSYSNAGLAAGTTYFYRVRAANAAGDSAYSNEASAATLAQQALDLATGYTLVALAVAPVVPLTAEEVAQRINAQQGDCASVIGYEGGAFVTHPAGTAVANFELAVGKGYFVRCRTASRVVLKGRRLEASSATVALTEGYNLIGLPVEPDPGGKYTAEGAGQAINAQNGGATQLIDYDTALGQFVTHPVGTAVSNFTLALGRGYFVRCTKGSMWLVSR
jgi:hypothetical protein